MKETNYKEKKRRERYYIKFSFYTLFICGVIAIIWGLYDSKHNSKILQYGEDTIGIVIEKGFGKSSKKSSSPSYFIRVECIIDSVKYKLFEPISKKGYDTIQVAQVYTVKYLPNKNPINNSITLFNKPIIYKFEKPQ